MFPKKKRVTKDVFQTIMDKGNIVSGSFFVFRYLRQDYPQYAFVVPKKLAKTAVKRNSLRRKGYNLLRLCDLKKDIGVFFYKKEGILASSMEISKDIEYILKKSRIL